MNWRDQGACGGIDFVTGMNRQRFKAVVFG
jgi:hypothetical protein